MIHNDCNNKFTRLVCDRVRMVSTNLIPKEEYNAIISSLKVDAGTDDRLNAMLIAITAEMPALLKRRIQIYRKFPLDWWEAFKERWFPQFILDKWPVKYHIVDIDEPIYKAVCPHIWKNSDGPHLEWLVAQYNNTLTTDVSKEENL